MTKIKICGLKTPQDIAAANDLQPEYIGFVFAQKSKRCITEERAKELKKLLSPSIKAAGVFVNESAERVCQLLNDCTIDIAQLHGDEDENYIARLKKLTNKPIIKAFKVRSPQDIAAANASSADFVLLDSGYGSGQVFDWSLICGVTGKWFLAGGLDESNVQEAIKKLRPYAVDVSSGVERDGIKDRQKMAAFVAAVREG